MAAVDRFEFLFRSIGGLLTNAREVLALVGILYTSRKTLQLSFCLLKAGNDHLLSKLSKWSDLRRRFGDWAGEMNTDGFS